MLSSELAERPLAMRVLGVPVVVCRLGARVAAVHDLCIHRGTPLSLGWIEDETLVCAYHGWRYAADGTCVRIPSLPEEQPVPRKARATTYRAEERYGLVWVCLDEPRAPIPAYAEAEDPHYRTVWTQYYWRANAARVVENVMDFAHFPWVHPGILGHRERPLYPPITVEERPGEISYVLDDQATSATRSYRVTLPFTLHMTVQRRTENPDRVLNNALVLPGLPGYPDGDEALLRLCARLRPRPVVRRAVHQRQHRHRRAGPADRGGAAPEERPLDLAAELHLRRPRRRVGGLPPGAHRAGRAGVALRGAARRAQSV